MSHTPGPWKLVTVPTTIGICHKIGEFANRSGRIKYACVYDDGGHMKAQNEELLANARLMAAAPDLLALCQRIIADEGLNDLIQGIGEKPEWWEPLHAAIAKAEGRYEVR